MPCLLNKILKTVFFFFFLFFCCFFFVFVFQRCTRNVSWAFLSFAKVFEAISFKAEKKIQKPISAGENLSITLRFLAATELHQSLSFSSCMGRSTVSNITSEMCDAIYNVLWKTYLQRPSSADELLFKQKISSNDGICLM